MPLIVFSTTMLVTFWLLLNSLSDCQKCPHPSLQWSGRWSRSTGRQPSVNPPLSHKSCPWKHRISVVDKRDNIISGFVTLRSYILYSTLLYSVWMSSITKLFSVSLTNITIKFQRFVTCSWILMNGVLKTLQTSDVLLNFIFLHRLSWFPWVFSIILLPPDYKERIFPPAPEHHLSAEGLRCWWMGAGVWLGGQVSLCAHAPTVVGILPRDYSSNVEVCSCCEVCHVELFPDSPPNFCSSFLLERSM